MKGKANERSEKYGFHTWSPEYAAQFDERFFGVDAK
jgi:hypothetical protein